MLYGHDEDGGAGEKPVAFLFRPRVSSRAADRATKHSPNSSAALRMYCNAPNDREQDPGRTTRWVNRLELNNSHPHFNTLVVKRLSSLPSKQGAGVRLPPSVAFSHLFVSTFQPRHKPAEFFVKIQITNVHPILYVILNWSL